MSCGVDQVVYFWNQSKKTGTENLWSSQSANVVNGAFTASPVYDTGDSRQAVANSLYNFGGAAQSPTPAHQYHNIDSSIGQAPRSTSAGYNAPASPYPPSSYAAPTPHGTYGISPVKEWDTKL